ncbi:MAG: OmpA family protein [Desulfobacteraceae bacterium]|nr:OmpA family protein [Desulfobacteraceae bacterium]
MRDVLIKNLKAELEMSERKRLHLQRQKSLEGFEAEDLSLWTMLDLMTLILIFFIILYANLLPITTPIIFEKKTVTPAQPIETDTPHKKSIKETRIKKKSFSKNEASFLDIEENMHLAMEGTDIRDYSIEMTGDRIIIVIGEKISFPVGQAELLEHIKTPLKKMAGFLYQEQAYKIIVSGHTDDTPIRTSRFPSNWELSVARALSVAKFLMAQDLDPRRISVEGFGQYQPIADNGTPDRRQANRRVEISLIRKY